MNRLLAAPWFLAVLALVSMLGTQAFLFYSSWDKLKPEKKEVLYIEREDPGQIQWSFSNEEILSLGKELEGRIASVEAREEQLAAYEERLKADRAEIEDIKISVEQMRERLMAEVIKMENAEQLNLKNLAKTYMVLDPKATVSIFQELDDATVVKILFFMKPDEQGAILEEMARRVGADESLVQRAAKLSDMLRLFPSNSLQDEA